MHYGTAQSVNYAKLADPPAQTYDTILGDAPQQDDCGRSARGSCPPTTCAQMSNATSPPAGNETLVRRPLAIQIPCDPASPSGRQDYQPYTPAPLRWFLKSCLVPNSFCLPIGCEGASSGKLVFCFPPQPPPPKPPEPREEIKPIGYISRNKDMDFIGGKIVGGCLCGMKNGLAGGSCPRISCRNNPGCTMNPPRCWPAIKLPDPPPPPPPDQKMICVPIQVFYKDPQRS